MVAIPSPRSPMELHARSLAADALQLSGIDRTEQAMDWLTEYLLEKAAVGCSILHEAMTAADAGNAIGKANLGG